MQDPFANHAMEKYSPNITVYGIDSAFMEKEDAIYPLTLLIDDSMRNGTLRLASPTSDDEDGGKEIVVIDSPKFEYV